MMRLSDVRWGARPCFLLGDTPRSPTSNRLRTALPSFAVSGSLVAEPDEVFTLDGSVFRLVGRLAYTDLEPQSVS
jgi:hypothetical protein